jgi:hypothetical protein
LFSHCLEAVRSAYRTSSGPRKIVEIGLQGINPTWRTMKETEEIKEAESTLSLLFLDRIFGSICLESVTYSIERAKMRRTKFAEIRPFSLENSSFEPLE